MNDYDNYMKDCFKLSPIERFIFGKRDKETLSHIDNYLSDEYLEAERKIIEKYKDTTDLELSLLISINKLSNDYQLYYFLFSSYNNFILDFENDNKNLYPKNEVYKKSREKDFNQLLKSHIQRAKEGLKLKITYPKMIIKIFLEQIKNKHKYSTIYNFIKNHYYPYCRNEIGLYYIKNGRDIYKNLLRESIGCLDISPEEIHQIGLDLLKNSKKKTSKQSYKSRKEMFEDCLKYGKFVYDEVLSKYFHFKPKTPFKIIAMDEEEERNSPLGYYKPLEKKVFINLSYYNEISKNEIHSLIMHECFHSFHYDFMKFHKIPKYKYYKYFNTALVEGFAFYMEIYCDNYDDDDNEMTLMRKLRLVVDTGINYYGWTYKKSFDFMKSYMPTKISDIKNEIERYICMPTQAISYMIGKIHILKLRDKYKGDIRDFHEKILIEGLASFKTIDKIFEEK